MIYMLIRVTEHYAHSFLNESMTANTQNDKNVHTHTQNIYIFVVLPGLAIELFDFFICVMLFVGICTRIQL